MDPYEYFPGSPPITPGEDPFDYIERVEMGLHKLKEKYKEKEDKKHNHSHFGTVEWFMILFACSTLVQWGLLVTVIIVMK